MSARMKQRERFTRKRAKTTKRLVGIYLSDGLADGRRRSLTPKFALLVMARSRAQMIAALRRLTPIFRYSEAI
jgi:hypothetical protein